MRVAAFDIGTNTVLLLIAEITGNNLHVIRDDHAIARLGEGVDRTHRISEMAYARFIAILHKHRKTIETLRCDSIAAVATSAMRDAENREEIILRTKKDTGIEIELLTGEDEARWTYRGAVHGMISDNCDLAVLDIGGGSTELSFGRDEKFISGASFDIGAVRVTELFFATGMDSDRIEKARMFIRQTLQQSAPRTASALMAVAGTPTTLAAMHKHLPEFNASKVQGSVLSRQAIEETMGMLFSMEIEELLTRYPAINKARADILPAGTLILAEVMDFLGAAHITVSTQGLRYGIALRCSERAN